MVMYVNIAVTATMKPNPGDFCDSCDPPEPDAAADVSDDAAVVDDDVPDAMDTFILISA